MLNLPVNETTALRIQAADGATNLFPQAVIYNDVEAVEATLNMAHVADGLYTADWTPTVKGIYTLQGRFYADVGHTTDAGFERACEGIEVTSMEADMARVLGLLHENTVIDNQVYDTGLLTAARIRSYDSRANAISAGATGLISTHAVVATYSGGLLTSYRVTLEP